MTAHRSEFLKIMEERGFIHQCTNLEGLDELLRKETVTAYCGVDPTGDTLHVGHMIPYLMMRWFQKCGHRPIVLIGGVTAMIGDPTGKDDSRNMLTEETTQKNAESISRFFKKIIRFEDANSNRPTAKMVNNSDWLRQLNYVDFLRDYGAHFSVNKMLSMDSVKTRLEREQPLSFLEFNYMIMQGYDYLELYRKEGCKLQMAGSDQWGNIIQGIELARRVDRVEIFGLTAPLLTTASGKKMGKTEDGAVWLDADKLSPYDFYQYWRNTEDGDVGRFLKIFTELSIAEIGKLEALKGAEINEAKKVLAFEVTKLVHGETAATEAAETARKAFEEGQLNEAPEVRLSVSGDTVSVVDLATSTGFVKSNGEARRKIQEGAMKLNGEKISDPQSTLAVSDITDGRITVSIGKKKHAVVVLETG
ncbi:MAG: tyrosine--tRNA ligase [Alphaproteobacteria bacterium]|nr:tyrosine--tRNA ligase [Alphaproteobacteria bacterium]